MSMREDNPVSGCVGQMPQLVAPNLLLLTQPLPPQEAGLQTTGGGCILTTRVEDREVFFHSRQTGAPEVVVVDEDFASLLPITSPG